MRKQIYAVAIAIGAALALCGCASERPANVPAGASISAQGTANLTYTAPSDGEVWVTDVTANNIVYSGHVRQGDSVVVDTDHNEVTVNGQVKVNHDITHTNHSIYFDPGRGYETENVAPTPYVVSRPGEVPVSAALKAEGMDRVTYTADSTGTIWVTDANRNNAVLYSGRVNQGDTVVIDPNQNALTLNGNKVYDQVIPRDNLRIFFQPEAANRPAVGRID